MLEALLSRFKDMPALVAPEHSQSFAGCLSALANSEDGAKLMAVQASAESDFWNPEDRWLARYRPYLVKDGILTIPVKGVLLSNFPFQYGGWATGYEYIWQAYKRGMEDSAVRGIAIQSHSPGGEVAECFDMVDKMFAMRDRKPVRAFAHEYAYSAAFATVSPFHLTVSRTGGVGSIGVVTSHVDMSKMMDDWGLKVTFIHYGKHKVDGNPYEALSPEVKARIQARIDELGELFVATVARNRGIDADAVRATEALTYSGSEAMSIGLADAVGPLDDAVAAFAADLSNNEGEEQMSEKANAAADQAAIDTARAAGIEEGKKTGFAEGQKAERTRISAILDSDDGKKRPSAAFAAALDTDMSAEQAVAFLAKLPEETPKAAAEEGDGGKEKLANASRFDAAMSKDSPNVGANAGGDDEEDKPSRAQRTLAMMGHKTGRAA